MELFEAIHTRRTNRSYTGASVAREDLIKIIDAARCAPSGSNIQPREFIVITDADTMCRLRVPEDHWSDKAGALIAIVMDPTISRWWVEDAAAAAQNILLAAHALGYAACWLEGYTLRNEETFKAVLGIPAERRLFTLIAIGVPSQPAEQTKKPLEAVLHWQHYS